MGQSITWQVKAKELLQSIVGTLRHAMQLQCHQIELLAIVKTEEFKRDTKGPTYKCLLTTNKKSHMRCSMLNLLSEGCNLKNMGPRLSLSKAYQYHCRSISWLWYDPSVNRTAQSYFTMKVNKKSKLVRDKTGQQSQIQWCKLKVFHQQTWRF